MQSLTDRQQQVLSFITSYIDNNGYPHHSVRSPAISASAAPLR